MLQQTLEQAMLQALEIIFATVALIAAFPTIEPYLWRSIRAIKRRRRWLIT
jgi:hypothetical protein